MRGLFLGRRRFECHAAELLKGRFSKSLRYLGDNCCDAMRQSGAVDINCAAAGLAGRPERFWSDCIPETPDIAAQALWWIEAICNPAA